MLPVQAAEDPLPQFHQPGFYIICTAVGCSRFCLTFGLVQFFELSVFGWYTKHIFISPVCHKSHNCCQDLSEGDNASPRYSKK